MENVKIKSSAFDKFNLPIEIKHGLAGKIELKIPYRNIILGIPDNCIIKLENIKIYTSTLKFFPNTIYFNFFS